jgi:hypothetical protein
MTPSALSDLSIASLFAVILPSRKDRASSPPEAIGRQAAPGLQRRPRLFSAAGNSSHVRFVCALIFPALHRETK